MPEDEIDKAALSEKASVTMREMVHFFDDTRWRRTFHRVEWRFWRMIFSEVKNQRRLRCGLEC
jgi:hypothetical protein